MSALFSTLKIRKLEFKNRIAVSPMCQYSSENGMPTDWHFVHLGSRAVGGAALVMMEATAVSPEGRISPDDAGIWSDEHAEAYKRITSFISSQNSVPGIQLAHAGRKASTYSPWKGKGEVKINVGGWQTLAPSAIPFAENYPKPVELSKEGIKEIVNQFKEASLRSLNAGFKLIELHFAHGYLVHEFLSPVSNHRSDEYGGSLENRCRIALDIVRTVRAAIPDSMPLFVRISASDWIENGWDIDQSVQLAKWLKDLGADLIDCSSGGNVSVARIPVGPGYQVPFAQRIKLEAGILTGAVGSITDPVQADTIIRTGQADMVLLAKQMLRNPYWPLEAAKKLNAEINWPDQYLRAK